MIIKCKATFHLAPALEDPWRVPDSLCQVATGPQSRGEVARRLTPVWLTYTVLNETTHCVRVIRPSDLAIPSLLTCVSPRSAVWPTMTPPWVV
jgi:hypothetical protein